jgi:hypothetical protein
MNEAITYCARHPDVETGLRCGKCDTPICPRCLVQTPVGARCRDCANIRRIPTLDVKPITYVKAQAAAIVAGLAVGWFWALATGPRGGIGFFTFFLGMGIGWAISEAVSLATNRRRGVALQFCAAAGVLVAFLTRNLLLGFGPLPQGDVWGYLILIVAGAFAASRLKY